MNLIHAPMICEEGVYIEHLGHLVIHKYIYIVVRERRCVYQVVVRCDTCYVRGVSYAAGISAVSFIVCRTQYNMQSVEYPDQRGT